MKRLILFLSILALHGPNISAQQETTCYFPLSVWVFPSQEMTASFRTQLENKLKQIVTANGLSGNIKNSNFIITAKVSVLSKDITATAPAMHAYTLDVTLYIGDGISGTVFSSFSTTLKGVGENETKAYLAALKNMKTKDPAYKDFIEEGKREIIKYYDSQCDIILKEVTQLCQLRKYRQALWTLSSIPNMSTCWDKSLEITPSVYQEMIDYECSQKLTDAKNSWNATQDWDGANKAGNILSTIDPASACFKDVQQFADQIAKRIYEVDKREWTVVFEKRVELAKEMINAYKEIGVAYGQSQLIQVHYKYFW